MSVGFICRLLEGDGYDVRLGVGGAMDVRLVLKTEVEASRHMAIATSSSDISNKITLSFYHLPSYCHSNSVRCRLYIHIYGYLPTYCPAHDAVSPLQKWNAHIDRPICQLNTFK